MKKEYNNHLTKKVPDQIYDLRSITRGYCISFNLRYYTLKKWKLGRL